MRGTILLLGLGGLAALPAFSGSCSLTSSQCLSGLVGSKVTVPISANFQNLSPGTLDTLTLTGVSFNGDVASSGTFSLTQGQGPVSANLSNVGFASGTTTVTVGMTFKFSGPDALNPTIGATVTGGTLSGPVSSSIKLNTVTITEVVSLTPTGTLFSLTNLFEVNQRDPGSIQQIASKTGGQYFAVSGTPLFNPDDLAPLSAPEPLSMALVGLSLVGGAALTMRHRRRLATAKAQDAQGQ